MSHVTRWARHKNGSKCDMTHSRETWLISDELCHTSNPYVMHQWVMWRFSESCHTHTCITWSKDGVRHQNAQENTSWIRHITYQCVTSRTSMSHFTKWASQKSWRTPFTGELCHKSKRHVKCANTSYDLEIEQYTKIGKNVRHEWVISHINASHYTHERVMFSMNESWHTCECFVWHQRNTTLRHAGTRCNALQHTATHCNTLQHTAT